MLNDIKVLVVDDNKLSLKIANIILEKQKATVSTCFTGTEAIIELKTKQYDVVLMDIQMPELDGFATTHYIRNELKSNIPVIGITAHLLEEEEVKAREAGMNGYLGKPFDQVELCEIIINSIGKINNQ